MNKKNEVKINGDDNIVNQIEKQVIINFTNSNGYIPDEYASKLLKETIEDEQNPIILYISNNIDDDNIVIQCGSNRFSVKSSQKSYREMSYWINAIKELQKNNYIYNDDGKKVLFKITKKGYDYYDKYLKEKF